MTSSTHGFRVETRERSFDLELAVSNVILAGWTGRDQEALRRHIHELAAHGVAAPATTPAFYPVSVHRLRLDDAIQVSGPDSSGEVEYFVVGDGEALYVGLGSDQTDRKLEAHSITLSKQLCDKVMARTLWPLAEVEAHWDQLRLRSWGLFETGEALYQDSRLAAMLRPAELFAACYGDGRSLPPGALLFSGTIPAIGGVRPASAFRMELHDPVLERRIAHRYDIEVLPVPA